MKKPKKRTTAAQIVIPAIIIFFTQNITVSATSLPSTITIEIIQSCNDAVDTETEIPDSSVENPQMPDIFGLTGMTGYVSTAPEGYEAVPGKDGLFLPEGWKEEKQSQLKESEAISEQQADRKKIRSQILSEDKQNRDEYGFPTDMTKFLSGVPFAYSAGTAVSALFQETIIKYTENGHITKQGGVFYGPSGKETYYNLPMQGVVKIMRRQGYSEEEYPYWVREDGAKMLGNYIMVAAHLGIRPRGTILETSMGTAMVCDTGTFAASNPTQLDLAMDW